MLCKLLKYDLKSMFRIFFPLWGIVLILSLINFILPTKNEWDGSSPIAILVMTALIVAVVTITVILVIQRFYNGLLKDEGYLMFTLPVHTWQLVLSKYITATTIIVLSGMVSVLAAAMLVTKGWVEQEMYVEFFRGFFHWDILSLFFLSLLSSLASLLSSIALIYLCMAIGHLFYKHRIPISIAAYIGINTLIAQVGGLLFTNGMGEVVTHHLATNYTLGGASEAVFTPGYCLSLVFTLAMAAIYLALTITILDKRLNLE